MGSSRASSGSTSAVCVCISLSPLAKGSSAARRGLQGGLQARWSQRGLCDAPHLELSERRGFGLQACVGAEGFITLCSRMPTSCLALSCLSHCPSEATSLAAPQDPRPPKPYSHSVAVWGKVPWLVIASHLELRCCWSSQVLFGTAHPPCLQPLSVSPGRPDRAGEGISAPGRGLLRPGCHLPHGQVLRGQRW